MHIHSWLRSERGLYAVLLTLFLLILLVPTPSSAQVPKNITMTVGVCDPVWPQRCAKPDTNGALPITGTVTPGAPVAVPSVNASGTVTLGGTYQTVFAASTARKGCSIYNPSTATETLSVRVTGATVWVLPIGGTFYCGIFGGGMVSSLVEVTATTTSHAFTAASQ